MVLLLPERQKVSNRDENQSSNRVGILEGDGEGQRDLQRKTRKPACGDEEDPGLLQRSSS